jgi:crotonobetainyl-CoA:carnitine CoA-transferase CaiB-like acyl-CoA transferase
MSRPAAVAADLLQANGVPAGLVQNGADLMADPQLVAREFWRYQDHQVFGERPFDRFPAIWSGTDLLPYLPSPGYLGEHNFEVFGELAGMDEGGIAVAMGDGLFG